MINFFLNFIKDTPIRFNSLNFIPFYYANNLNKKYEIDFEKIKKHENKLINQMTYDL